MSVSPPTVQRTTIETSDNIDLVAYTWSPGPSSRGAVAIIHGYGHHTTSFEELAGNLCASGFTVHGFDQRGHGLSPGKRGHIASFATDLDDMSCFLDAIRPATEGRPLFIFGHSLGGLILGHFVVEHKPEVAGLVFSSALLKIPDSVSPLLVRWGNFLGTVTPWLPVQKVDYRWVSRDAMVLESLLQDPLRHTGVMNARTGAEIARTIAAFEGRMPEISDPVLLFHGAADRLTDPDGTRALYSKAASEDKTLEIFEDGYHELFNDLERERFTTEMCDWLVERS